MPAQSSTTVSASSAKRGVVRKDNAIPLPWTHGDDKVKTVTPQSSLKSVLEARYAIWQGDVIELLRRLPSEPLFDLVVTSPPYNLGKEYEKRKELAEYLAWQAQIIDEIVPRVRESGSICWQVTGLSRPSAILHRVE